MNSTDYRHTCRRCLQRFRTHLEVLTHSSTDCRWNHIKEEEAEEGELGESKGQRVPGIFDGVRVKEEMDDTTGDLVMEFKVEEEGPADCNDGGPGQHGDCDRMSQDVPNYRELLDVKAEDPVPETEQKLGKVAQDKKNDASSYYYVQGIKLRHFSVVVDPMIICPTCSKQFLSKQELKEHEREEHLGRNDLEKDCASPRIKKKGKQLQSCAEHGKRRTNNSRTNDRSHVGAHAYKSTSFTCNKCRKSFDARWRLSAHMAVHSDDRPFHCGMCNKTFKYRRSLKEHQYDHTGKGLNEAMKKLLGDGIGYTIDEGENYVQPSTGASLSCPVCSKILTTRSGLIKHVKVSHLQHDQVFTCELCYERCDTAYLLKAHKKHAHNIGKMTICKYCGKDCLCNSARALHERSHTGEKPFACSLRSKRLSSNRSLRRHRVIVHSKETPFICDKCGKGVKLREQLKNHMAAHSSGAGHRE